MENPNSSPHLRILIVITTVYCLTTASIWLFTLARSCKKTKLKFIMLLSALLFAS